LFSVDLSAAPHAVVFDLKIDLNAYARVLRCASSYFLPNRWNRGTLGKQPVGAPLTIARAAAGSKLEMF
jgi:hypothetical protein